MWNISDMETLKTSEESPNGGCVISELGKVQNPYNETLEKASGLSCLSEKCNGLVLDPEFSVRENGSGAGISSTAISNVEVVNHLSLDIENRAEGAEGGGSVGRVAGTIENGKSSDFGEIHNRDEDTTVHRVSTTQGLKEINASHLNAVDPGSAVEVSRKGISLFVDVFGPSEDFDQFDDSNCPAEHSNFNMENDCKENDVLFPDTGENTSAIVSEIHAETIRNQECRFSVGDFVWAKIKTHLWWPALICDPSNTPSDASKSKSNKRECLMVRYFGNGGFIQCASTQLKPFLEYFEQMSKQSNSRSFLSAVDKAVGEVGMCVKLEMTCSCLIEESTAKFSAEERKGKLGEFSVKRFEPANFLAYVKDLAKDVSISGVIESTVTQNRLSAFYRTIGHCQLPMNQLVPTTDAVGEANDKAKDHGYSKSRERRVCRVENDDFGEKNGKSDNAYELRERRKSKFLTAVGMDMNSTGGLSLGSDPKIKIRAKKSQKKQSEKPIMGCDIKVSSAEMLSELRLTALDCLYPHESKYFDLGERFFSQFRRISFHHEGANEQMIDTKVATEEDCSLKVASGAADVNQTADNEQKDPQEKCDPLPSVKPNKRRREKKQGSTSAGSKNKPTTELSDMQGNIATRGPVIIDFQNMGPLKSEVQYVPKKRKKAVAAVASDNGNITTSSSMVIDFQKMGPLKPGGQSVPKKRTKKAGSTPASSEITNTSVGLLDLNLNIATNGPMIIDFQKTVPFSPEGQFVLENGTNNVAVTPVLPQFNGKTDVSVFSGNRPGLLCEDLQFTGFTAPQGKLEPKRRKKKEGTALNAFESRTNVVLPNVKGSSAKFVPVLKDVQVESITLVSSGEGLKETALLNTNTELTTNKPDVIGNNAEPGSLMNGTQRMSILSLGVKPESKKRKRKCETKVASAIPDLNQNTTEPNLTDCIMPEGKSQAKKRSKAASNEVCGVNFGSDKVQNDGEALGTALHLKFAADFPLPPKEALVSTFCGFGPLKESETLVFCESRSAQVVFLRSCDARNAFLSLKKCSPFGPALVNYQLHHLSALEPDGSTRMPMFLPIDGLNKPVKPKAPRKPRVPPQPKTAAKPELPPVAKIPTWVSSGLTGQRGEAPDLVRIRQNLEMMTSMMEKAGNNLSPQMRAKLEGEINGLLMKVRTMSSSS